MRVLLVNHFPLEGSGSGVYTANLANSLMDLGHSVCVLCPTNVIETAAHRFPLHPVYFSRDDGSKPTAHALDFNFPAFTTHPASNNRFDMLSNEQLRTYVCALQQELKQAVSRFQPDIIHCGHVGIVSALASEFHQPLVITCHGTELFGLKESSPLFLYAQRAVDAAHTIICISANNRDALVRLFPAVQKKCLLMNNCFDSAVFYPEWSHSADALHNLDIERAFSQVVAFAGKLTYFKGADVLLEAAALYETPDVATVFAGTGHMREQLEKRAAQLGLRNVFFVGQRTQPELRALFTRADVVVVPSRNEPFGLTSIEAAACGAPVVATNDGGLVDIIVDAADANTAKGPDAHVACAAQQEDATRCEGSTLTDSQSTGILVSPDDPTALAKAVWQILSGQRVFDRAYIAQQAKERFNQRNYAHELVTHCYEPASFQD